MATSSSDILEIMMSLASAEEYILGVVASFKDCDVLEFTKPAVSKLCIKVESYAASHWRSKLPEG